MLDNVLVLWLFIYFFCPHYLLKWEKIDCCTLPELKNNKVAFNSHVNSSPSYSNALEKVYLSCFVQGRHSRWWNRGLVIPSNCARKRTTTELCCLCWLAWLEGIINPVIDQQESHPYSRFCLVLWDNHCILRECWSVGKLGDYWFIPNTKGNRPLIRHTEVFCFLA